MRAVEATVKAYVIITTLSWKTCSQALFQISKMNLPDLKGWNTCCLAYQRSYTKDGLENRLIRAPGRHIRVVTSRGQNSKEMDGALGEAVTDAWTHESGGCEDLAEDTGWRGYY